MRISPSVLLMCAVSIGCSNPFDGGWVCTDQFVPGIVVEIRDAGTGIPVAEEARGAVREGTYVDSLRPGFSAASDPSLLLSRFAAGERAGTYSVEIQRSGYQTWTANNVVVVSDRCHVITQRLRADLIPAP